MFDVRLWGHDLNSIQLVILTAVGAQLMNGSMWDLERPVPADAAVRSGRNLDLRHLVLQL